MAICVVNMDCGKLERVSGDVGRKELWFKEKEKKKLEGAAAGSRQWCQDFPFLPFQPKFSLLLCNNMFVHLQSSKCCNICLVPY